MAQQEGCSSPPRSLSRFSSLPTPFLHTHISRRARCTLAQLDNMLSPCPLSALAVRQIPLSPPNRVAFEPAALLFLYQGCCRHHNRHRNLCPAIIRLLLDTEKRCPWQLYKIGGKCRLFFPEFCRFERLSAAQLSRK